MTDNQMTIEAFISKHGLFMERRKMLARPDRDAEDWDKKASHWQVYIQRSGYRPNGTSRPALVTSYSMGSTHTAPPQLVDVLDSLACDTTSESFEDWASNFGYDTDSRKAFRTYEACLEITQKLRDLLGYEAFRELLDNVERL